MIISRENRICLKIVGVSKPLRESRQYFATWVGCLDVRVRYICMHVCTVGSMHAQVKCMDLCMHACMGGLLGRSGEIYVCM
jgi:hypothetical protein